MNKIFPPSERDTELQNIFLDHTNTSIDPGMQGLEKGWLIRAIKSLFWTEELTTKVYRNWPFVLKQVFLVNDKIREIIWISVLLIDDDAVTWAPLRVTNWELLRKILWMLDVDPSNEWVKNIRRYIEYAKKIRSHRDNW